jgi:putative transposase
MRRSRQLVDGCSYHVTSRVNHREMLLNDRVDKELFLSVIKRAKSKYSFSIESFCVLNNHFHLIIHPGKGENLSRIMQWILSVFAMAINKRHGLDGHLWSRRFFSSPIFGLKSFAAVCEYIMMNPIKSALADHIDEWEFSSTWHLKHGIRDIIDDPLDWDAIAAIT